MTDEEQEEIDLKTTIYKRFREQFPESNDADFAELVGISKQNIYRYKFGINFLNVLEVVKRYPDLDWSYIMTGRPESGMSDYEAIRREIKSAGRELLKIANKLQEIEDKIPNK